tara:strand:- start:307 stop:597 length:291 start_codon:yes stop_codon:yes gene_type:complete
LRAVKATHPQNSTGRTDLGCSERAAQTERTPGTGTDVAGESREKATRAKTRAQETGAEFLTRTDGTVQCIEGQCSHPTGTQSNKTVLVIVYINQVA